MPEENFNEQNNQPQDQPGPESQDQPGQESGPELDPFERVLQELPEDKRKVVEEAAMRHKAFTQKTQKFSEERKRYEQQMRANQNKIEFYNKFRDDDNFRQEVLSAIGAPKKVQKSDDLEEQYEKAQELINNLDPDSRKAMQFLIKKNIRDELMPFQQKVLEFERQQTEKQRRKAQQLNAERQQVLINFQQEYPDYVDVEPVMEKTIKRFPGFFNQNPQDLKEALVEVYNLANLPKYKQKAEEKGIKKMLDQNIKASVAANKSNARPSSGKTYSNVKTDMDFDECFDKVWGEKTGG